MNFNKGPELWMKAKKLIPGGSQLLSKRSEMYLPEHWPSYYQEAKGADVWDLDGNHLIDMSTMGIGACPLGYADEDIDTAVKDAVDRGSMCTLNCPEEVELAESLIKLHPWAEMVRYARGGGEAMAIAVRIARARTGKNKIAFCGYHGWHDWYLAANLADDSNLDGHLLPGLCPVGVPRELIGSAHPFHYNAIDELSDIQKKCGDKLAAIVMEPVRDHDPHPKFLSNVKKIAEETGAVLIFDEVSSGFRLTTGGSHLLYGTQPDIAVFAKAMSNGYPMASVIGIADVMQAAQDSFISSTFWTERIGPVATLATIEKYERLSVPEHLIRMGKNVQNGWQKVANETAIDVEIGGIPPLSHFAISHKDGLIAQTLFTQIMLDHGYLAGKSYYASYAHNTKSIQKYLDTVHTAFSQVADALEKNMAKKMLKGPVAHTGFQRLT